MNPWIHPVRRFLSRFRKPHIILPVSFLNSAALTMVGFGIVYYLRDAHGATAGSIGLAAALQSGLYFTGCFALRPLTTRLLPRYSAILSSLMTATFLVAIMSISTLAATVVLYGLFGFGVALFWPPVMGWLSAGIEGRELNRVISKFNVAWILGTIVGPYLAGVLVEIDLKLPLIIATGVILVNAAAIGAVSVMVDSIRNDRYVGESTRHGPETDSSTPLRFPSWVGIVAGYTALGVILVVFPLYGREVLGMSESSVGGILLFRGLAAATIFVVAGRSEWWHFNRLVVQVPGLVLAAILVLMLIARNPVTSGLLVALAGAPIAAAYTLSVFHGVAGSQDRTRRMAIHEALLTVGAILGSSAGGWAYQQRGWSATVMLCIALVVVAVMVQAIVTPRAARIRRLGG